MVAEQSCQSMWGPLSTSVISPGWFCCPGALAEQLGAHGAAPAGAARRPVHLHGRQVPSSCSHHPACPVLHESDLTCQVIF